MGDDPAGGPVTARRAWSEAARRSLGSAGPTPAVGARADAAAAAALALATLAAVPGARGVLGPTRSLTPVLVAAAAMHVVAWVCRRRLGALGLSAGLAATPLLVAWIVFPATTTAGLPLAGTWRVAGDAVRRGLEAFGARVPAVVQEGAVVREGRLALAVLVVSLCVLLADQVAFRMRRSLFALVPSLTIVILGATRAPAADPGVGVALWLAAAAGFLLAHRAVFGGDQPLLAPAGRAVSRFAGTAGPAAAIAAVAVTSALAAGPHLPGYGRAALVTGAGTELVTPGAARLRSFVDLNPTLTERSDAVMFTVASPVAAYWRLTSLDEFDGRTWSQSAAEGFTGSSPAPVDASRGLRLVQRFRIGALRSEWLPAAFRAQVPADGAVVAGDSATLRTGEETVAGQVYQVVSVLPQPSAAELRLLDGPRVVPALRRYLAVPVDLPRSVVEETARVTSSTASTPYFTALALQGYFRNEFRYDASVAPGAGQEALERFLFQTRRGYCEQFAAAFAVMARVAGLPARVAVGFTPGDRGPDGRYTVRGLHAHAWPEVYLDGAGWVAFEPTPGRGIPDAEAYTGVPPAQATPDAGPGPTAVASTVPAATAPTGPVPTAPTATTQPRPAGGSTPSSTVAPRRAGPTADRRSRAPALALLGAAFVGAAFLGAAAIVPLAKRRRREARRRRAPAPGDRVLVAWSEATEALAAYGLARRPTETLLDHAARVAHDERLPAGLAGPVLALAGRAGTASYGGRPVGAGAAEEATAAAARIAAGLRRAAPVRRRVAAALDPRPLWVGPRP